MFTNSEIFTLYIHVPFCKQACSYCDFYFVTREKLLPEYTNALINEIRERGKLYRTELSSHTSTSLHTIYFGGGTPSRLPIADIERIMQTIEDTFGLDKITEITMEVNPDDVSSKYLSDLKSLGINRLSMGIQTFDDHLLKFMHRAHDSKEALKSLELVKNAGFKDFTVDLIYGNPGQSLESLEKDIDILIDFEPPHISAYALTIEPNTRLGKAAKLGRISAPDDEDVARHMKLVNEKLSSAGINRYETSNFAREGHEAKHNSSYWEHIPYLGVGPGAHSLLTFPGEKLQHGSRLPGAKRWSNPRDLAKYIQHSGQPTPDETDILNTTELAEERLLMGLRTRKGVSTTELLERYNYSLNSHQREWVKKMRNEKLMHYADSLRLTDDAVATSDHIVLELISRYS